MALASIHNLNPKFPNAKLQKKMYSIPSHKENVQYFKPQFPSSKVKTTHKVMTTPVFTCTLSFACTPKDPGTYTL